MENWNYDRLKTNLKRYSFESKMNMAALHSTILANPIITMDPNKLRNYYLPEEIETFVMLSINNKEWQRKAISEREFGKSIMAIRNHMPAYLEQQDGEDFGKWILICLSATQFFYQENPFQLFSRYYDYFTFENDYINMNLEMRKKFGYTYQEIAAPMVALWLGLIDNKYFCWTELGRKWLIKSYSNIFELFSLSREEYIQELNTIANTPEDYKYCLRPSYKYPFVDDNGRLYLPLPHLLMRSVTISLMHRLTERNDRLRSDIGLHVLEHYLLQIINESGEFDEVIGEQEYTVNRKQKRRTIDVMSRIGTDIICFDSKSLTPTIDLRVFSSKAYRETLDKISKAMTQMYKHIHDKYGNEYEFLSVPVKVDRSNIYGIVVVGENPYLRNDDIYKSVAEKNNIDISSNDYLWLKTHVGIVGIDVLETQLLNRGGFLEAMKHNEKSNMDDHWFMTSGQVREKGDNQSKDIIAQIVAPLIEQFSESDRKQYIVQR